MKRLVKPFLGSSFLIFAFCAKEPVGFEEIGRGDTLVYSILLFSDSLQTFEDYVSMGKGSNLLVGKDSLYEARMLIEISINDTIKEADSAFLILYPREGYINDKLKVKAYPIKYPWDESYATWILSTQDMRWDMPGGDFDTTKPLFEFYTQGDSIVIDMKDYLSSLEGKYGMMFIPESPGFFYFFSKEGSSEKGPKFLYYLDKDKYEINPVQDASLIFSFKSIEVGLVGSGYDYTTLVFFSIDTIFEESELTDLDIVGAELAIPVSYVYSHKDSISVGIYDVTDNWKGKYTKIGGVYGTKTFYKKDTLVTLSIREEVQKWVDDIDSNYGISISILPKNYNLTLFKIKPPLRLDIYYIKPPESRF